MQTQGDQSPASPVATVSAIVEREHQGRTQILVQIRWKPDRDPVYSGTFEIPAGGIEQYENVYEALKREVFEETGLRVTAIRPEVKTAMHAHHGDQVFAFLPFCCHQQVSGRARIGFVFICTVEGSPAPAPAEVKEIMWLDRTEVRRLLDETPQRVFTYQRPVPEFYLGQCSD